MIEERAKELLVQKLVELAVHEVETREEGGENQGERIRIYQRATWLAPGLWPWCAAFTCWLLREWLKFPEVMTALGLRPSTTEGWRCKDASAFGWEEWAKKRDIPVLPETELARAGDFMVFDMSHIGLVIADQALHSDDIYTIEGNTRPGGGREGDGVWTKTRHYTLAKSFIRIL